MKALLLLLFSIAGAGIVSIWTLDEPFGPGLDGLVAGGYSYAIERSYALAGFQGTKSLPYLACLPSEPALPVPESLYPNHPLFYRYALHAWVKAFGLSERSLRGFSVLALGAGLWALGLGLKRRFGMKTAVVSLAFATALPTQVLYGSLVNYEPLLIALALWAFFLFERWPDSNGVRLLLVPTLVFLATLTDWIGAFAAIGLCALEWSIRGRQFRWTTPLFAGVAAVFAVCTHLLTFAFAKGIAPTDALNSLLKVGHSAAIPMDTVQTDHAIPQFLLENFSLPGLLLCGLGLCLALRDARRLALFMGYAAIGIGNLLLFPWHASTHSFWVMPLVMVIVPVCSEAIAWLLRSRRGSLLAAAALVGVLTSAVWAFQHRPEPRSEAIASFVKGLAHEGDLLAFPFPLAGEKSRIREPYVDGFVASSIPPLLHATVADLFPWPAVTFVVPLAHWESDAALQGALQPFRPVLTERVLLARQMPLELRGTGLGGGLVVLRFAPP